MSGSGGNSPSPRPGLPGWAWGLGACACLPIAGVILLGIIAAPALRRIKEANREAGRSNVCLVNVKQIATSMQMYAQDYDDHLPAAANWMDASAAYSETSSGGNKAVFQCPTVQVKQPSGFGYAFNTKYAGKPFSKIAAPAVAQLVYDSSNLARNASDAVTSLPNPARHHGRRFRPGARTFNIMGYVDGHAKAVSGQGGTVSAPGLDTNQ